MIDYSIDINEFIHKSKELPVIDVRSPGEFYHGHIPGAFNLPVFSDEERSIIGTLYTKSGSSEAIEKGLQLVRTKTSSLTSQAFKIAPSGTALMHCWRGGMRSNCMAWLLNAAGIKTYTLKGGYKAYRNYIHKQFNDPLKLLVIGGMTGSGKTSILECLQLAGEQIIHLEKLANHKGSVFGAVNMQEQPTTEQFENNLFREFSDLDKSKLVFIEDESISIGNIFISRGLYDQMITANYINLIMPVNRRIDILVDTYAKGEMDGIISAVRNLDKRLGSENSNKIIDLIIKNELHLAVEMILKYYDKHYAASMAKYKRQNVIEINIGNESYQQISEKIVQAVKEAKW